MTNMEPVDYLCTLIVVAAVLLEVGMWFSQF